MVSSNGVYKVLCRHGLNTRRLRLALVAGYRAPYEPPREPDPELHIDVHRPDELVGIDCFKVGRLRDSDGEVWQLTAIDVYSSFGWADLVVCPQRQPHRRADIQARGRMALARASIASELSSPTQATSDTRRFRVHTRASASPVKSGATALDEQRACRGAVGSRLLRWHSDSAAKLITRACSRVTAQAAPRSAASRIHGLRVQVRPKSEEPCAGEDRGLVAAALCSRELDGSSPPLTDQW